MTAGRDGPELVRELQAMGIAAVSCRTSKTSWGATVRLRARGRAGGSAPSASGFVRSCAHANHFSREQRTRIARRCSEHGREVALSSRPPDEAAMPPWWRQEY